MNRGRYIALEGIEGAGKSTIHETLSGALRQDGIEVVSVREPGGTATGEGIRRLLLEGDDMTPWAEALLFAAQRSQLADEVIEPALRRGAWVIGDRSVYSSLAYQGGGRGLGIEAVRKVNQAGLGTTWPDLVIVLAVDPQAGLARQDGEDRIGGQGVEFQRRVAGFYAELAAAEPDRVTVVDAGGAVGDVTERVVDLVRHRW
ncbi:MAG: dTMP kinase [Acidimicrobiia bacterium]